MCCCPIRIFSAYLVSYCHSCSSGSKHPKSLARGKLKMVVDLAVAWSVPPCLIILHCMSTNFAFSQRKIPYHIASLSLLLQQTFRRASDPEQEWAQITVQLTYCKHIQDHSESSGLEGKEATRKSMSFHFAAPSCSMIQGLQWLMQVDSQSKEVPAAVAVHFAPAT